MNSKDLVKLLTEKVPQKDTWRSAEPYGLASESLPEEVNKVLYCVTPTKDVIEEFRAGGYDLLISHHPFKTNVPHMIFHTALDCCEGGLNDMWRDALGVKNSKHFDENLGWYGEIDPISYEDLCIKVEKFMGYPIIGQKHNKVETIKSVVICTGLGGLVTRTAQKTNADCYVLGEAVQDARFMGFPAVIETGHTHSEWIGVRLFKKLLEPHGVQVDCASIAADKFNREVYQKRWEWADEDFSEKTLPADEMDEEDESWSDKEWSDEGW